MTADGETDLEQLVREYTSGPDARALYVYNGPIYEQQVEALFNVVEPDRDIEASLFLCTLGGDPHSAYRLTRFLRGSHKSLRLLLTGPCKSAGTLVAIGSHGIAFSPWGELGPLDVQIARPEELLLRSSGLDLTQALATVVDSASTAFAQNLLRLTEAGLSTRAAARIATGLTTGLFKEIAAQIEPLRLGEAVRANQIAMEYGRRLATGNLLDGALERLVSGYPDHAFVIDWEEAFRFFASVDNFTATEIAIALELGAKVRYPALEPHQAYIVNAAREYGGDRGDEPDADDLGEASADPVREEAGRGSPVPRTAREGRAEDGGAEQADALGAGQLGEAAAAGDGAAGG